MSDPPRAGPAFAATVKLIVVLPTPDAGRASAIQFASLRTDHEHPSVAVRRTDASWLFSSRFTVAGDRSKRQAAAACATSTICSATTTRPRRDMPLGLASAL